MEKLFSKKKVKMKNVRHDQCSPMYINVQNGLRLIANFYSILKFHKDWKGKNQNHCQSHFSKTCQA